MLQQDTAGAAARATEAAQELLRQASRDGQVLKLEGRRLVSCVSSMRLNALPKGSRDELIAYTAFFAALEVSRLTYDQRLACYCSRQVPRQVLSLCLGCPRVADFGQLQKSPACQSLQTVTSVCRQQHLQRWGKLEWCSYAALAANQTTKTSWGCKTIYP